MTDIVLTPMIFLDTVTASTVTNWVPVDYRYGGIQQRSISGSKAATAGDEVNIELKTSAASQVGGGTSAGQSVIVTATTFNAATTIFSAVIQGPFTDIRVRKVGASAAVTVVGVV